MFFTLAIAQEIGKLVFMNPAGIQVEQVPEDVEVRVDRSHPFAMVSAEENTSTTVERIPTSMRLSERRLGSMKAGPPEKFRSKIGLSDATETLTVALWLEYRKGAPRRHEFLVGGPPPGCCLPPQDDGRL